MRASLHFNLNDLDDRDAHLRCIKALDLALALWKIRNDITSIVDTSENGMVDGYQILTAINEVLTEYDINFENLIR